MDQHTIPNSYLKAWCDPTPLPEKYTPFIWRISKDGAEKRKRAPHKAFTESDRYTVRLDDGGMILTEERRLGATEDAFVRIRPKIEAKEPLTPKEELGLCAFAAAMFARSKGQGDHFTELFRTLHAQVEDLEKERGALPGLSLETRRHAENGPASTVAMFMLSWPLLLKRMNLTFLCTDADEGFITSDHPFVLVLPDAHRLPPALRYPAPGDPRVEITLPLTPNRALLMSHIYAAGYMNATQGMVDELNGRTRFGCDEYFVSWKGVVRDCWFASVEAPTEAWENSPEGIAAEQTRQRWLKAKAEYEAWLKRRENQESPFH